VWLAQLSSSAPLPTTEVLRPLPPLPQRTVRLSVTPQLRTGMNPPPLSRKGSAGKGQGSILDRGCLEGSITVMPRQLRIQ
jgi:hypothetical protein